MKKGLIAAFKKQTAVLKRRASIEDDRGTDAIPAAIDDGIAVSPTLFAALDRKAGGGGAASRPASTPKTPESQRNTPKSGGASKATPAGGKIGALLPVRKTAERRGSWSEQKREKKKSESREERQETKENDSVPPSDASPSSTATTPNVKKKKKKKKRDSAMEESAVSPGAPPSTTTTPKSEKAKVKKSAKMKIESPPTSNGIAFVKAAAENESEAEAWPSMLPFEKPVKPENSAERQRLKAAKKLKKRASAVVVVEANPANTVPRTPPSRPPTVPLPMRDTVRQSIVNGYKKEAGNTPKHIRFASESPVTPNMSSLPSSPLSAPKKEKQPIDNGRTSSTQTSPITVPGTKIANGRVKRESSPEISTTSSDSDDGDKKKESARKKKLTKKPEVTSSPKGTETSKMTPPTRKEETVVKRKSIEQSPKERAAMSCGGKKKLQKKIKKMKREAAEGMNKVKKEADEDVEEPLRPSSDLLRMVAAKLANNHGHIIFRNISKETRRIAEQQLQHADSVLHLAEFDDENAFTHDDMTQWWEQRREAEDTSVPEGKKNLSHAHISAYIAMRKRENRLLTDMDGGMAHPSSPKSSVSYQRLLQHPLQTLDAACLMHEEQPAAVARLLQQEGAQMTEVWLGHFTSKLARELPRLRSLERFEHRQATMATLQRLPMTQMTELRLDIVDDAVTRSGLAAHLVNGIGLLALELNVAPTGPLDGSTASHYTLFTRRSYDRDEYEGEGLEWMIPNIEAGDADPVTLCMPSLEHLATNVANVKLFWQLRDATLLLRHLRSLRVGTLSRTKELITSIELFADTKESRRYKQPGFFSLRDAYETELESVTLRLTDRVGVSMLQREVATMFEAIGELPPSLRRLSISLFYNQFASICAPFRKWAVPGAATDAPDTGHVRIEEVHLHFERAFDLRGLPALLPASIKTLSIAVNYENEDDAKCLGPFIEMLPGLARLECLEDLHIQVWGVRCLQPVVAAISSSPSLAARLARLAVAAYPINDEAFFEGAAAATWVRTTLAAFPLVRTLGLHAAVLVRMIPAERRSGYSWRNGLAWLANDMLSQGGKGGEKEMTSSSSIPSSARSLEDVEIAAAPALPALDDGEDYTICPHWEVEYDAAQLVLSPEDEEENVGMEDSSYSIPHGSSDEEDDFITDDDEEDFADDDDAAGDELEKMEEGLEDETARFERRQQRREEKKRAAIERGEVMEAEEEEEGELIDFDSISDEEDAEPEQRNEFFDDEAAESDREESGDEEGKQEESAESGCSSEDDDRQREEERMKDEARRQKRLERKQAKLDDEMERRNRKRAFASEDEDDDEIVIRRRAPTNKRKKVIIDSDED